MEIDQHLSKRSHEVEWSGIRIMFALADEIPNVVNLGIGQPDFDTPEFIRDAAKQALDDGFTRYPPAKGFEDLRRVIAAKPERENNIAADPDTDIYVAVGAMQVIFNTCLHLLNKGDEVIVIDCCCLYILNSGGNVSTNHICPAYYKEATTHANTNST